MDQAHNDGSVINKIFRSTLEENRKDMRKFVDLITLDRLDRLIRLQATGPPTDLAQRLKMSRSSLFELIAFLRDDMGAPIRYHKYRQSYVYDYPPRFYLGFEKDRLQSNELDHLSGRTVSENHNTASDDHSETVKSYDNL